ncbi:conjugal transfer protein MobB, partial [Alistipes shahii]
MVANITTGKDVYGALAYNQEKVDRGDGKVLLTHIVREPADGRFNVAATAEDLLRWMPSHYRTEKPVVHVSLNPAPEDRLDDGQLAEIAGAYMERMGWGGQPYIVFKHTDIGREHIHIVSVQVAQDGRKINDSRRNERSVAVTEELEREYGLHPAKGRRREKGQGIVPADYTRGDLKRQVAAVIKPAVATYRFQTLGEFRALLSLYNIGIEEVRGERNGTPYRGLLYTLLDENGDKAVAAPLKSSLFGKEVGYDGLERHMERNAERFGKDDTRRQIRGRVDKALRGEPTEEELRERLRGARVDLYIRRNENGRIVGVTFIDHETRTV